MSLVLHVRLNSEVFVRTEFGLLRIVPCEVRNNRVKLAFDGDRRIEVVRGKLLHREQRDGESSES